jgi:hypothetical protein
MSFLVFVASSTQRGGFILSTIQQNFDTAGAAKWLGVSKTTLCRLPYSRVGRRIVIQLADLRALLASTRVAS